MLKTINDSHIIWQPRHWFVFPSGLFILFLSSVSLALTPSFFVFCVSCWLSLEGGLLYAFVGPAAAVVLVQFLSLFDLFTEIFCPSFPDSMLMLLASLHPNIEFYNK